MVAGNEDILGGLKSALSRGYSLEEAMLSMYNAGYKREDIEGAARAIQMQAPVQNIIQTSVLPNPLQIQRQPTQAKTQITKPAEKPAESQPQLPVVQPSQPVSTTNTINQVSKVSKYSGYEARLRAISIILIVILVVLLGILGVIFIFKQEIISFFNSIF